MTLSSPGNTNNVSDTSDDGDDTDGNTTDDKTIIITASDAAIEVTKTATVTQNDGNLTNGNGDVIVYTFTIENKGNVTLSNLTLTDNLTDAGGGPLSLNSSPTFVSASGGSTSLTLLSSGVVTYTASYTITQSSANTGGVNNLSLIHI